MYQHLILQNIEGDIVPFSTIIENRKVFITWLRHYG